ncbi:MAG: hypothetical protein O2819_08885 [Planctomycetota bacterium]|nr:hypothetical protein [Planctomycetota bacterium]MDA1105899.1 hypothetical protein [Planctomycetota bacterium]
MRWMWIDAITHHEPNARLVAVKNISMAEEHLHDHFAQDESGAACPVMPTSLVIEGTAQTAGILVGSVHGFREKVILAKISSFRLDIDPRPGQTLRYDARIERMDASGASTETVISLLDHTDAAAAATGAATSGGDGTAGATSQWREVGRSSLMFSHIDQNRSGLQFPEENFVFSENFRTILRSAGLEGLARD